MTKIERLIGREKQYIFLTDLANIGTRREDGKRVHCIFSKNLVGPREKDVRFLA
jgi:hypothetical protein